MKFARCKYKSGTEKKITWGIIKNDRIEFIEGTPFGEWKKTSKSKKDYEVQLLAPCQPTKIICVGLNYHEYADERGMKVPEDPVLFIKPADSSQLCRPMKSRCGPGKYDHFVFRTLPSESMYEPSDVFR